MKKSFVLRLDTDAFTAVEQWANDEFRSVNGQLEWIISEALKKAHRHPSQQKNKRKPNEESQPDNM
ncbi:MAG: hypothetical protein IJV22_09370 [Bacteroidales bacterium]|nr:hypothetical protein [Bacteroidales bacterium]